MKANTTMERRDGLNLRPQSVVGLLLLTLLAANPLTGFSQGVISADRHNGAILNSLFSPPTNTVTVMSGVIIDNAISGNNGVAGNTYPWNLINESNAMIDGKTNGVYLRTGGSVVNNGAIKGINNSGVLLENGGSVDNQSGIIQGHINGVEVQNFAGSVTNAGTISGSTRGVALTGGGTVDNQLGGTIQGGIDGVGIIGTGSVVNAGAIIGTNNDGVHIVGTGSVNNLTNGTIAGGQYGVEITGAGSVTNHGSITGASHDGVRLRSGGTVDNQRGGFIGGNTGGVKITGGLGTVINRGTIIGTNDDGVSLGSGGSVDNQRHGTIRGGDDGVQISGGAGSVVNHGTITGAGAFGYGVNLVDGGSVSNLCRGIIQGNFYGVGIFGSGGTGSVVNAGTIIGTNNDGVHISGGGSVNNQRHGTISGGSNGVSILDGVGSVVNHGTITGAGVNGVDLEAGGTVSNLCRGIIRGNDFGVYINNSGGTGVVFNTGTIIGTNSAGVYIAGGGSVNNRCGGTITGLGDDGVEIEGGVGSVVNHGTITGAGSDGYGVYLVSGGSVSNLCRGIILGNQYGVYIKNSSGTGVVYNAGTIIGTNNDGVHIGGGGSVYNSWHGTISGGSNGVSILDGVGSVVNHGTIIGAGPVGEGVYLANGGSVDNLCRGIIQGNNNGVYILNSGGTGSVVNAGKIIGTNNDGVYISGGGSVDNQRWGTIKGPFGVAIVGGAASVTNAGKIIGTSGTAISLDNYNNTVVLKTGSCVQGDIVGGTDTDAAILQGHGWYGNSFLNFETLTVQASGCRGWNLTGTNIFTTGATVETGLLRINGELDTQLLTVSNSAGLGGAGTIVGIVDNHGYFKPGNSIGTLTIIGSMTNWGDYNVQVDNAGNSDRILVSDTATINSGWVYAQPAHEVYGTNTVYTILTATNGVTGYGVTGSYDGSSITPLFPSWLGFVSSLSNDLNNVYLTLHRDPFVSVANTYNQRGVAGALDGIVTSPGPGMSNLVSEFFWLPSATAARAALDSMSGEIHGTLGMLDMQQQDAFNRSVSQRTGRISAGGESGGYASAKPVQLADASSTLPPMQPAQASQSWDVWLQGFGSFGHLDGDGNALGGTFNISGLNGGLDYRLRPEMLIGLALGYSYDDASVGGPGEDGNVSAFQIAGYGGYVNGPWHLDGIFSYGFLSTDTKRYINVGSIHQEAKASYDGGVLSLSGEGGYAFEAGRFTIEPTLGLDYTHLSQDSFNETGIATDGHNYGLNVHSVDMDSFRTALGARLSAQFGRTNGVQFIPELRAGWEHEFMDKTADVTARFIGGSGDFIVRGVELGADSAALGAGLTVAFNKAIQASVNYDARLNERLTSQAISGRLSFSW